MVIVHALSADVNIRAGRIESIELKKDIGSKNAVLVEVSIVPAYKNDEQSMSGELLPDLTEERVVVEGKENKLTIVLDRIGAFDYQFKHNIEFPFIESFSGNDLKGSYKSPDIILDEQGREYRSFQMNIQTKSAIYYRFVEINRDMPGLVKLCFAIQEVLAKTPSDEFASKLTIQANDLIAQPGIMLSSSDSTGLVNKLLKKYPPHQFVSILVPLQHIDPDKAYDLIKARSSLLGDISVNRDNPSLLITDQADYVQSMTAALHQLDQPVPQAMIEVRILEVTWRKNERIGFDWNVNNSNGTILSDQSLASGRQIQGALQSASRDLASQSMRNAITMGSVSASKLNSVTAQLDLLSQEGRVKLLASTHLKVINNHKASFHAGSTFPMMARSSIQLRDSNNINSYYEKNISRTQTDYDDWKQFTRLDGDGELLSRDETSNWHKSPASTANEGFDKDGLRSYGETVNLVQSEFKTGVQLEVVPNIRNGREVSLDLTPSVTEVTGWRQPSDMPILSTRQTTTSLKALDGETIVIAGLFREISITDKSGVPGLSKIPFLGRFFRTESESKVQSEIVFLLNIKVER